MVAFTLPKESEIRLLSNDEIHSRLCSLVGQERRIELAFVLHLAEFDKREAYELKHQRSLWDYCTKTLGLLEGAANRRITSVRIIRRFPLAITYLREGKLWVSTLAMLEKQLQKDASKAQKLFDAATGKSRKEVETLLGKLNEVPVVEVEVAKPVEKRVEPVTKEEAELLTTAPIVSAATAEAKSATPPPTERALFALMTPEAQDVLRAVSATQYEFRFFGDQELYDLFMELRDLTPNRRQADLFKRGLIALREKIGKRNGTIPVLTRASKKEDEPRLYRLDDSDVVRANAAGIPIDTWRRVYKRDEGMCTYILKDGSRCCSTRLCEPDHKTPRALGGSNDEDNLQLVCHMHNQRLADQVFGKAFMDEKRFKK